MKKILIFIFTLVTVGALAQKRTVDTLEFVKGGQLFQFVVYNTDDVVDSIQVNGYMVRLAGVESFWQSGGTFSGSRIYVKPNPENSAIKYPYMPQMNSVIPPVANCPVWWRASDKALVSGYNLPIPIVPPDTVGPLPDAIYIYNTAQTDAQVVVDSISKVSGCFTIKNTGAGSEITLTNLEGLQFDAAPGTSSTTLTIRYGEWYTICPDTNGTGSFSCIGYAMKNDSTYTKKEVDTLFVKVAEDSLFRYSAYSSGNNNIEVLATTKDVTASLANSNEFTFTIPAGTKILSAKIRVENLSSVVVFMGTADMPNESMATRWMPTVAAWREDTGQQLMGMTTLMDLSNYSKFTVNGLINTTRCQIRIGF